MDLADIDRLISRFEESDLATFALDLDDAHLEMSRTQPCAPVAVETAAPVQGFAANAALTADAASEPAWSHEQSNDAPAQGATLVKAPLVGLFYRASSPDAEPFVEEGQRVEKGQVLCIIEAMKVMNEVESPISGTVVSIAPANGAMVSFDETLMEIIG